MIKVKLLAPYNELIREHGVIRRGRPREYGDVVTVDAEEADRLVAACRGQLVQGAAAHGKDGK